MNLEQAAEQVRAVHSGVWPDPEPIGEDLTKPGPFPTAATPRALRNMIRAVASNKQVPEDLPALLGLSAAAILAGPRVAISRGHGWVEPLVLYTVTAMDSGTGKSPAEADVTRPLRRIHKVIRANFADMRSQRLNVLRNEISNLEKAAGAARDNDAKASISATMSELKAEVSDLEDAPAPRVLFGSDTTVEALADQMSVNGEHAGIMDGEGEFFAILSGRYTRQVPNLGLALKAYDGHYYEVGRIGRRQDDMSRAILSLGLAVQPLVLTEAVKSTAMRERGLLARFLFAAPPSLLGTRADEGEPYDRDAMDDWAAALEKIASLDTPPPDDRDFPALRLSRAARRAHVAFKAWMEPRLHPDDGDLGDLPGWASKHVGRALRIAGLLHLLDGGAVTEEVDEQWMAAAIEIARWAIPHAVKVYGWEGTPAPGAAGDDEQCRDVLRWIARTGATEVTTRVVCRKVRKKWVKEGGALAVANALGRLVDARWLAVETRTDGSNRDVQVYLPHPQLLAGPGGGNG